MLFLPVNGNRITFRKIGNFIKNLDDGQNLKNEINVSESYSLFVQPVTWSLQKKTARRSITSVSFIRAGKENGHSRDGVQVDIPAK